MNNGQHILGLYAENFKKIRVVQITPDGNMTMITGKNGQGKTSVLDAIWFALKGKKAQPLKAVRKGAERMKVKLDLGICTVTRTLTDDNQIPTLHIEMKVGKREINTPNGPRAATPQEFLDDILGELTFDPLAFIHMDTKQQVAELRKTAKVDIDFEQIAFDNKTDYDARTVINKEVKALEHEIGMLQVLAGLPKEKIDTAAIEVRLNSAGEANRQMQEVFKAKQELGAVASRIGSDRARVDRQVMDKESHITSLEAQLKSAKDDLRSLKADRDRIEKQRIEAEEKFQAAPAGDPVDVGSLVEELQSAQRTNRAIDVRVRYDKLLAEKDQKEMAADKLTRKIDDREEKKRAAIEKAHIPVDGLVFDEKRVLYKGMPLDSLGEGEQIRISALIGMAANPKLRVLCIRHGEALDEDGLKVLAELAKENDFQIWMARVDSSGKVGIVMEDGMVAARNEAE